MTRLHIIRDIVVDLEKVSAVGPIKRNNNWHRYKIMVDGNIMLVKLEVHHHKSTSTRQLHEFMNERSELIRAWAAYHAYSVAMFLEKEWSKMPEVDCSPDDASEASGKARGVIGAESIG